MNISKFVKQLHDKGYTAKIDIETHTYGEVKYDMVVTIEKDDEYLTAFDVYDESAEDLFKRILDTLEPKKECEKCAEIQKITGANLDNGTPIMCGRCWSKERKEEQDNTNKVAPSKTQWELTFEQLWGISPQELYENKLAKSNNSVNS